MWQFYHYPCGFGFLFLRGRIDTTRKRTKKRKKRGFLFLKGRIGTKNVGSEYYGKNRFLFLRGRIGTQENAKTMGRRYRVFIP